MITPAEVIAVRLDPSSVNMAEVEAWIDAVLINTIVWPLQIAVLLLPMYVDAGLILLLQRYREAGWDARHCGKYIEFDRPKA